MFSQATKRRKVIEMIELPLWFFWVLYAILVVIPYWRIFPRAAWPSWMAILMSVPILNIILLWTLAFKKWPDDEGSLN